MYLWAMTNLCAKNMKKAMGWVDREQVPEILAAADILVQPGWPRSF